MGARVPEAFGEGEGQQGAGGAIAAPRIAIFGGTFDPIHAGHLAAARAVLAADHADEVCFVPSARPPHKPSGGVASPEQRWLMAVLATLAEPRFRVERWELDRPGASYAIDTVAAARAELARRYGRPVRLQWIIGTDAMALVHTWRSSEALFEAVRFTVVTRAGFDEAALRREVAAKAPWAPADAFDFVAMDAVEASSTALRAELAQGRLPAALPEPVQRYLARYPLYEAPPLTPPLAPLEAP